jgi:hypothetical protein
MNSALLHKTLEAVREDNAEAVERAVVAGVNLGPVWLGRQTMLMQAAKHGSANALRVLLPRSNAKLADMNGETALMMAANRGCASCVAQLMAVSDAQARDNEGKDALFHGWSADWRHSGLDGKIACLRILAEELDASRPQSAEPGGGLSVLWRAARRYASREIFEVFGPQFPLSEEVEEALANWGAQEIPLTHAARERALLLAAATSHGAQEKLSGQPSSQSPKPRSQRDTSGQNGAKIDARRL